MNLLDIEFVGVFKDEEEIHFNDSLHSWMYIRRLEVFWNLKLFCLKWVSRLQAQAELNSHWENEQQYISHMDL